MKNINRILAVLGAGAVLDFDYDYNGKKKPTTAYITSVVANQKLPDLDDDETNVIRIIYDKIVDLSKAEYKRFHPFVKNYEPSLSFEDLFEVIETLHSYSRTWKHEHYPFSLISALVHSDLDFMPGVYHRAMVAIIKAIIEIVGDYDEKFKEIGREEWYKEFWKAFEGRIDVFNFNYDTTIENSLENYVDGFVPTLSAYQRFEPEVLWKADANIATVNHLHGCILYADPNPQSTEFYYSHRDLYKFKSAKDVDDLLLYKIWLPQNQVGDTIYYSPIITGLKKTDKICYMPHNFYHANLAKKIIENPSLLICGYSFGDLYVNQLLQRHKLIHDKNERVVVIDQWPLCVNEDNVRLYRHFIDKTTGGFKEYVERINEGGIEPSEIFRRFIQISDGCWESPNGVFRLYTKGMKDAVENHRNELLSFLL